jgi:ribonuclease HI
MVHIVTDGGARPNPGSGGWGALMRQSGHYAINWGHWDLTTNNAMELLAVTEALANLPDGMHVWVMTDSAYVKNGITQWVPNWIRNGWKNSSGNRVANKSLWERLIAGVNRMRRVEWSWVKAHNGRLLNECADMLATRGVHNQQRPCPVSTVRVVGEDTDHEIYELQDGEETPTCGKDGEGYPEGKTYVLKANESARPFGIAQPESQIVTYSETTDDECPFPMPEDPPEQETTSSSTGFGTLEEAGARAARQLRYWSAKIEWESRPKPEWWSQAWEEMAELKRPDGTRIPTGSPAEFKECITGDVIATDSWAFEAETNGVPGEDVFPSISPNLTNVVVAGVWTESGSTMIRRCGRDIDINELSLAAFKDILSVTPDACELRYVTCSDWLLSQWADMIAWKEADYDGLDRKECPHYWEDIMGHAETRLSKVTMIHSNVEAVWPEFKEAVRKYGIEGLEWYRRYMETPDGAEYPPVAPLF